MAGFRFSGFQGLWFSLELCLFFGACSGVFNLASEFRG